MSTQDGLNGLFELIGGLLLFLNCRRLYRDRTIKGVSWTPVAFFTCWGFWNLYYYPHLGQTLSFLGGLVVSVANLTWLGMLWFFSRPSAE